METMQAYLNAIGARNSANPMRQIDWERAKTICEENPGKVIYAGLRGDMEWTSGRIFDGEKRVDDGDVYAASVWATPILEVDFVEIECWKYGSDAKMPSWWSCDADD